MVEFGSFGELQPSQRTSAETDGVAIAYLKAGQIGIEVHRLLFYEVDKFVISLRCNTNALVRVWVWLRAPIRREGPRSIRLGVNKIA